MRKSENEIRGLIAQMSLAEKAALCSGADAWTTKPNPAKGIPSLRMADGPHGIRREDKENTAANGGPSIPATCFPPAVTMACSWNPALMEEVGQALGEEAAAQGVRLLLGPGVNIKRDPRGGRNFEYFSEDPLLAGEMGAAWINGIQSRGVGASLKHYAVNSQESKRMSINAVVDERAFFDLYLKPFEIAVQKAQPATVMASYNKINGTYACDNRRLLTDILRLCFGFSGAVVSDWGAVNDRAQGIFSGLDLEMPGSGGVNDAEIVKAVREGRLAEDALDTACWNLLRLVFTYAEDAEGAPAHTAAATLPKAAPACNYTAHHQLAVQALCQGAVLLKNENILPFGTTKSLCVIGEMADKPRYQGGGSSIVNPKQLTSFLAALDESGQRYTYAPGYRGYEESDVLVAQAAEAAKNAQQVVLFAGQQPLLDCEGYDRPSLSLCAQQEKLIAAVLAANPNTCVVLCCGGPVCGAWLDESPATLCLHLGGEGVGEGARRLLFGLEPPSGKLAESWPLHGEDAPAAQHFPMGPRSVTYNESLYVGYRYYSTAGQPVRYPFGHGLSYTRFAYSNISLAPGAGAKDGDITLQFTLTNTGSTAGDEISQVYVHRPGSSLWQPALSLAGFARTSLDAGESRQVRISIPYSRLACYQPAGGTSVVEAGLYVFKVGGSSTSLPLEAEAVLEGVQLAPTAAYAAASPYAAPANNGFPDADFEALYGAPLPGNLPVKRGEYGMDTTLGEMQESPLARRLVAIGLKIAQSQLTFSTDPAAAKESVRCGVADFPFKNIVLMSDGLVDYEAAAKLLDACNGRGGFWPAVARILGRWRNGKKKGESYELPL